MWNDPLRKEDLDTIRAQCDTHPAAATPFDGWMATVATVAARVVADWMREYRMKMQEHGGWSLDPRPSRPGREVIHGVMDVLADPAWPEIDAGALDPAVYAIVGQYAPTRRFPRFKFNAPLTGCSEFKLSGGVDDTLGLNDSPPSANLAALRGMVNRRLKAQGMDPIRLPKAHEWSVTSYGDDIVVEAPCGTGTARFEVADGAAHVRRRDLAPFVDHAVRMVGRHARAADVIDRMASDTMKTFTAAMSPLGCGEIKDGPWVSVGYDRKDVPTRVTMRAKVSMIQDNLSIRDEVVGFEDGGQQLGRLVARLVPLAENLRVRNEGGAEKMDPVIAYMLSGFEPRAVPRLVEQLDNPHYNGKNPPYSNNSRGEKLTRFERVAGIITGRFTGPLYSYDNRELTIARTLPETIVIALKGHRLRNLIDDPALPLDAIISRATLRKGQVVVKLDADTLGTVGVDEAIERNRVIWEANAPERARLEEEGEERGRRMREKRELEEIADAPPQPDELHVQGCSADKRDADADGTLMLYVMPIERVIELWREGFDGAGGQIDQLVDQTRSHIAKHSRWNDVRWFDRRKPEARWNLTKGTEDTADALATWRDDADATALILMLAAWPALDYSLGRSTVCTQCVRVLGRRIEQEARSRGVRPNWSPRSNTFLPGGTREPDDDRIKHLPSVADLPEWLGAHHARMLSVWGISGRLAGRPPQR